MNVAHSGHLRRAILAVAGASAVTLVVLAGVPGHVGAATPTSRSVVLAVTTTTTAPATTVPVTTTPVAPTTT